MKRFQLAVLGGVLFLSGWASAATTPSPANNTVRIVPLEEQLKELNAANQAPSAASPEKLYAVQARYLPLKFKSELSVGGASNLTSDSFMRTQQAEVGYRFHFNDRWSLGIAQAWVDNTFKSAVDNIKTADGAIPDVPYATARTDLMVEFNAFYGKFRWSAESVSYFDQYWAVGPGIVQQSTGSTKAAVADAGFAFWLGQRGSVRVGLKDYYYSEDYRSGAQLTHNIHAHLDLGIIF